MTWYIFDILFHWVCISMSSLYSFQESRNQPYKNSQEVTAQTDVWHTCTCAFMNDHHDTLWIKSRKKINKKRCTEVEKNRNGSVLRNPSVREKVERRAETANMAGGGWQTANSMRMCRQGPRREKKKKIRRWSGSTARWDKEETARRQRQEAWESDRAESCEGECVGECESSAS